MYLLTNEEMRRADEYTIRKSGTPSSELMERAGQALAREVTKSDIGGKALCVCGGGNNGGDGFVCARILHASGVETDVLFFAERETEDCAEKREKYIRSGGKILSVIPTITEKKEYAVVIDCLVGTGLHGSLQGKNRQAVEYINALKAMGAKVFSADIPSGLNGKNGRAEGVCVHADETLCMGEVKTGVVLGDGADHAGKITRADIGIRLPETGYAEWIDGEYAQALLPKRKRNSHKGTYGRAAVVAGSVEYTGAAMLAATACARSGAGYTVLFLPKDLLPIFFLRQPEILIKSINDGGRYAFNRESMEELLGFDSVAYGMGMGVSEEVAKGAAYLLEAYTGRLILDADGLNALAAFYGADVSALLKKRKCDVVLTPHVKEFSSLSGYSVAQIKEDGICLAKRFAKENGVCLLLKDCASIVTDGTSVTINTTGNSGQAKGGSGDVLSGVLAGLCAMGASCRESAIAGSYLTGRAAELAAAALSEYSLLATDCIAYLGKAFLELV